MTIETEKNGASLTLKLVGRLDTTTSPQLEKEVFDSLDGVTDLIFDFSDLEYISSAGLRVMLASQKAMSKKGTLVVRNVRDSIKEVFDITGFSDILTIV